MINYVGIDHATFKRVWGWARVDGRKIYIFWGQKDSNIKIVRSYADSKFYNNLKKKKKKYKDIAGTELADSVMYQLSEFLLFDKLKHE